MPTNKTKQKNFDSKPCPQPLYPIDCMWVIKKIPLSLFSFIYCFFNSFHFFISFFILDQGRNGAGRGGGEGGLSRLLLSLTRRFSMYIHIIYTVLLFFLSLFFFSFATFLSCSGRRDAGAAKSAGERGEILIELALCRGLSWS